MNFPRKCTKYKRIKKNCFGFTLIELLIVIAIMGVLATIVVVAVDPLQRIVSTQDAARISGVSQLGRYIKSMSVASNLLPTEGSWDSDIINSGEISSFLPGIRYLFEIPCETNARPSDLPTYCYDYDDIDGNGYLLFTKLDSTIQSQKCSLGDTYFVYSSSDARAGIVCSDGDPSVWPPGTVTYVE